MSDDLRVDRRRLGRIVLVVFALLVIAVGSLPFVLYRYGLSLLPRDALQATGMPRSDRVERLFWASLGGTGEPELGRVGPYGYIAKLVRAELPGDAADGLSVIASRVILDGSGDLYRAGHPGWILSSVSAYIWVGKRWTPDVAIAAVLDHLYYGHELFGLDAAAEGYFGRSVEGLDDAELLSLMVTTVAPQRLSPWCRPELNLERVARAFEVMGKPAPTEPVPTLPPPPDACGAESSSVASSPRSHLNR